MLLKKNSCVDIGEKCGFLVLHQLPYEKYNFSRRTYRVLKMLRVIALQYKIYISNVIWASPFCISEIIPFKFIAYLFNA